MKPPLPVRADNLLFLSALLHKVMQAMEAGHSVTRYVFGALSGGAEDAIEFEVRVTRIGRVRVPPVTQAQAERARQAKPPKRG